MKHPMEIGGNIIQTIILQFILLKDGDEGVIYEVTINFFSVSTTLTSNVFTVWVDPSFLAFLIF